VPKPRCLISCAAALTLLTVLLSALHLHDLATTVITADDSAPPIPSTRNSALTPGNAPGLHPEPVALSLRGPDEEPIATTVGVADFEEALAEDALVEMIDLTSLSAPQTREPARPRHPRTKYTGPPRRLAGDGCSFSLCPTNWQGPDAPKAPWSPVQHRVGGLITSTLPRLFVVIPFRNRLDNLVRLLSGLNNSTTPQQRGCMCIVVADFSTQVALTPEWKNLSCLATWHEQHSLYVGEDDVLEDLTVRMDLDDIVEAMQPHPCPTAKHGVPRRLWSSEDAAVVHLRRWGAVPSYCMRTVNGSLCAVFTTASAAATRVVAAWR
jgi:hypothetical protein